MAMTEWIWAVAAVAALERRTGRARKPGPSDRRRCSSRSRLSPSSTALFPARRHWTKKSKSSSIPFAFLACMRHVNYVHLFQNKKMRQQLEEAEVALSARRSSRMDDKNTSQNGPNVDDFQSTVLCLIPSFILDSFDCFNAFSDAAIE